MNLLEYHDKISSTIMEKRIARLPEESALFELLNGSFNIHDIADINIENEVIEVAFCSIELATRAHDKFDKQNIPGVFKDPLYRLKTKRDQHSLKIEFERI